MWDCRSTYQILGNTRAPRQSGLLSTYQLAHGHCTISAALRSADARRGWERQTKTCLCRGIVWQLGLCRPGSDRDREGRSVIPSRIMQCPVKYRPRRYLTSNPALSTFSRPNYQYGIIMEVLYLKYERMYTRLVLTGCHAVHTGPPSGKSAPGTSQRSCVARTLMVPRAPRDRLERKPSLVRYLTQVGRCIADGAPSPACLVRFFRGLATRTSAPATSDN